MNELKSIHILPFVQPSPAQAHSTENFIPVKLLLLLPSSWNSLPSMKFSLAALALLATFTLALPSGKSRLEARLARRAAGIRSTSPLNRLTSDNKSDAEPTKTQEEYSGNWAGVVIESPPAAATFTAVSATITIPVPSSTGGSDTQSASAWVGIDGDTCANAILQTGVDFTVQGGSVSFDSWYEWYPDYAYDFSGISYSPGDVVVLSVVSSSSTSGTATIENTSTGQSVNQDITSSSSLCGTNAEWIVEDFDEGGSQVPFANFGTVDFSGAVASLSDGSTASPGSGSLSKLLLSSNQGTTANEICSRHPAERTSPDELFH